MKHKDGQILTVLGLLLIAAALFLCAGNLLESRRAQLASREAVRELRQYQTPEPTVAPAAQTFPTVREEPPAEMKEIMINGRAYIGTLTIPALELELGILSRCSPEGLKTAPCRYTGGVPTKDLVICAHNYPGHFGKIGQLQPGDPLLLTDAEGNRFAYQVDLLEVLPPDGVVEMAESPWELTLFTCTPGGKERLTIRCSAIEETA